MRKLIPIIFLWLCLPFSTYSAAHKDFRNIEVSNCSVPPGASKAVADWCFIIRSMATAYNNARGNLNQSYVQCANSVQHLLIEQQIKGVTHERSVADCTMATLRLGIVKSPYDPADTSLSASSEADSPKPDIIYDYKSIAPDKPYERYVIGLTDMSSRPQPGDGCETKTGLVKIEGIQFDQSGTTLQSFRFTDSAGHQWSVPMHIDINLSNAGMSEANDFIRVGKSYFIEIQVCGSGGFPSLINMYAAKDF